MRENVVEYVITYKDGDEFITEDKSEADEEFAQADKSKVSQYFRKEWEYGNGNYNEGDVEVYYND